MLRSARRACPRLELGAGLEARKTTTHEPTASLSTGGHTITALGALKAIHSAALAVGVEILDERGSWMGANPFVRNQV